MSRPAALQAPRSATEGALRLLVVVALVVSAVVHLALAEDYQLGYPEDIGGGTLFRLAAGAASPPASPCC